jgi:hypothetical protein
MSKRKQPDKEAVFDEVWDDDRVRGFLHRDTRQLPGDPDFNLLLHAYQSMRIGDFERFVPFFVEAGHRLDATNERGCTFADYVSRHRLASDFVRVVCDAGARPPAKSTAAIDRSDTP